MCRLVGTFLRDAEAILDTAAAGWELAHTVILIDRHGGIRMFDSAGSAGWSLSALTPEFGAAAAYRIDRREGEVRVEGWDGTRRCLLQRPTAPVSLQNLPGIYRPVHAMTL